MTAGDTLTTPMAHDPTPSPDAPAVKPPTPRNRTRILSPAYPLVLAAALLAAPLRLGFVLRDAHGALAGELQAAVVMMGGAALVLLAGYSWRPTVPPRKLPTRRPSLPRS